MSAHEPPVGAAWYNWRHRQRPAEFLKQPVGLLVVADGAGRHAVFPHVLAAPAARDHVVDGLRAAAAVGAPVIIPAHQRRPGQRHPVAVRNADVAAQPDHRRRHQGHRRRVQYRARRVIVDDLGLAAQHEAYGSAETDSGQRFIRHVEQQHSSHRTSRWRRLSLSEPHAPSVSPGTRIRHHLRVQGDRDRKVPAWASTDIRRRVGLT